MENKYKILVADDSSKVKNAVCNALNNEYNLEIVSTPEEAINYQKQFDLLLTDFYFGKNKKRGTEIIKEWKSKKKNLSAILMSSDLNKGVKRVCKKLNVPTFAKYEDNETPINKEKLIELIRKNIK